MRAEDLIRETALLESQILYLEKYLLSLYRKSFSKRLSPTIFSRRVEGEEEEEEEPDSMMISSKVAKTNSESMNGECSSFLRRNVSSNTLTMRSNDIDSSIYRSHSSLSQHSACSFRASPPFEPVSEVLDAYHSLPLSMLERRNDSTSSANTWGNLASSYPDRVRETPNWLSEEMIKCTSAIYRHLSHPPSTFSQRGHKHHCDIYTLSFEENSSFESWLNRPFHSKTSKQLSGSLFHTVEIHEVFRDSQKLNSVQELVQNYRSLISKLALVDPRRLRHAEKLAFWTNVHNALVMHAFMVYGIPRGNLKRMSLVLKAAYNIGGHTISVDTIQNSILGCRLPRPTPWLHLLFYPKTKFKAGDPRKAFAVKQPEPRLHFALCSGCQSDPAVRLYTPKRVFQELEMAKEEYTQTNIRLNKEQRLMVPKNVEYYIKEMGGLSQSGVPEIVEDSMPDSFGNLKLWKKVDWIPHNFAFRFLLSDELVQVISNQDSKV
ncbi:hypothetical protein OROGR_031563 [Orobanche gracilis]